MTRKELISLYETATGETFTESDTWPSIRVAVALKAFELKSKFEDRRLSTQERSQANALASQLVSAAVAYELGSTKEVREWVKKAFIEQYARLA